MAGTYNIKNDSDFPMSYSIVYSVDNYQTINLSSTLAAHSTMSISGNSTKKYFVYEYVDTTDPDKIRFWGRVGKYGSSSMPEYPEAVDPTYSYRDYLSVYTSSTEYYAYTFSSEDKSEITITNNSVLNIPATVNIKNKQIAFYYTYSDNDENTIEQIDFYNYPTPIFNLDKNNYVITVSNISSSTLIFGAYVKPRILYLGDYINIGTPKTISVQLAGVNADGVEGDKSSPINMTIPSGYKVTIHYNRSEYALEDILIYDNNELILQTSIMGDYDVLCTSGTLRIQTATGYYYYFSNPTTGITLSNWGTVATVTRAGELSASTWTSCFVEGTQINLADGTTKKIEDITYDDDLLVWNFYEGKFDKARPQWIMTEQQTDCYNYLEFSDGNTLSLVGSGGEEGYHRIYNQEACSFTHTGTKDTPVGTHSFNINQQNPELVRQTTVFCPVKYYNIITEKHYNLFANNILTSCRLSNLFNIQNMKYTGQPLYNQFDINNYFDKIQLIAQPKGERL